MNISSLFETRRHHKDFHLGLGDIRLTIGDQESIVAEIDRLRVENEVLHDLNVNNTVALGRLQAESTARLQRIAELEAARDMYVEQRDARDIRIASLEYTLSEIRTQGLVIDDAANNVRLMIEAALSGRG